MKANVPYRTHEEIWVRVDQFRVSAGVAKWLGPPLESVSIAEVVMRLNPIRFPELFFRFHLDAMISHDLKDILIDAKTYDAFESNRDWASMRLRFTVAHEIGHIVLHSNEITACNFCSLSDFKCWMGDRTKPYTPEYQADEFAGRLLVPREPLLDWYDRNIQIIKNENPKGWQTSATRSALSKRIAPHFGVNHEVIETRLDREGLWKADDVIE